MRIFLSVISHGHDQLIAENTPLQNLAKLPDIEVVVRDNCASPRLASLARSFGFHYSESSDPLGFGANNNQVFELCETSLAASSEDYFCLLNPDVVIEPKVLVPLITEVVAAKAKLASINLYKDTNFLVSDLNIKKFPSLIDFIKGFVFGKNPAAYEKQNISSPVVVDWASGAFLLIRMDLYKKLKGFDERFFMYLEDVDICRRALELCGEPLWYFPQFKAVHLCQQANKKLFSKHFYWFISSMIKYFWKYRFRQRP